MLTNRKALATACCCTGVVPIFVIPLVTHNSYDTNENVYPRYNEYFAGQSALFSLKLHCSVAEKVPVPVASLRS
jgi:hypothetical protein